LKSAWQLSDAFFCKEDRGSCATMQCKQCGLVFEADVEETQDPSKWILLSETGSNWRRMILKCPGCPNHEEHKTDGRCTICTTDEVVIPAIAPEELKFELVEVKRKTPFSYR
jgi:hypothetical protein